MNEEMVRRMLGKLSDSERDTLADKLMGTTTKAIREAEDSIKDGGERKAYELGKQVGVLEFLMGQYEKF